MGWDTWDTMEIPFLFSIIISLSESLSILAQIELDISTDLSESYPEVSGIISPMTQLSVGEM